MQELNDTLGIIKSVELTEKQTKQLLKYGGIINALGQRMEGIDVPGKYRHEMEDTKALRSINFTKAREESDEATVKAIEVLDN